MPFNCDPVVATSKLTLTPDLLSLSLSLSPSLGDPQADIRVRGQPRRLGYFMHVCLWQLRSKRCPTTLFDLQHRCQGVVFTPFPPALTQIPHVRLQVLCTSLPFNLSVYLSSFQLKFSFSKGTLP